MKVWSLALGAVGLVSAQSSPDTKTFGELFCDDQTDVNACNDLVIAENYAAECDEDLACWETKYDDSNNALAMEEFLEQLKEDVMMEEVLVQLNGLEDRLKQENATRSLGGDMGANDGNITGMQDTADHLRRFVELKQLVSWMQPKDKRISRYCFYGCWCLPDGAHSFVAGEGHPVDLVDRACQLFWFCYVCAKQEMTAIVGGKKRTCIPDKTKYTFRFKYDKKHPAHYDKRDIVCKDNWYNPMNTKEKWKSNCAKAFCECDRGIAMRLYKSWKHWDKSRHRIWSQRVTECDFKTKCLAMPIGNPKLNAAREECLKQGCLFIVKYRCLRGAGAKSELDQNPVCCGVYEDDGSRWEMRDHGGRYDCCNHDQGDGHGDMLPWNGNWYNTITHCCANGKVESAGGPNC